MKKLSLFFIIFLIGCVSIPRKPHMFLLPSYQELKKFCQENKLDYSFNTLDDIIYLKTKGKDIRLLLNSSIVFFNGCFFSLKNPPFYEEGKIYIPLDLKKIISKKLPSLKLEDFSTKTVVIDPGHGGKDPGAISPWGLREKDINLKVAKLLKKELEKKGFLVYLTRDKDKFLSLKERVKFAKEKEADLFISIHANFNRNRYIRGVEIYYLSPYFSQKLKPFYLAKKERNNYSLKFWKNLCYRNNSISKEFANCLVEIFKEMGFKVTSKRAKFYVLKYGYVPAILVEIGYLSNYYEERLLRSARYQRQVARAISLAVSLLNDQYEKFVQK